jgi:FkbM family methyltransferase
VARRLLQRAVIKFWRLAVPRFSIVVGQRRVQVSGNNRKPAALLTWEQGWMVEIIRRILAIEKGDFIDVGANVGQTLLDFYAAAPTGRYVGFEPHPNSYASICTLASENTFENCVILPIGLSDSLSVLNLYSAIGSATDSGASIDPELRGTRELRHTQVLCCRFDDLRVRLSIASIGLIKIDVEGAEIQVLRGMEKTLAELRVPLICEVLYASASADITRYEITVKSIMEFLVRLEYLVFRVRKDRDEQFQGLESTSVFPIQIWTEENAHECDYLMIPKEKRGDYAMLMAATQDH